MILGSLLSRDELIRMAGSAEPLEEIAFDEEVDINRFLATVARRALELEDEQATNEVMPYDLNTLAFDEPDIDLDRLSATLDVISDKYPKD